METATEKAKLVSAVVEVLFDGMSSARSKLAVDMPEQLKVEFLETMNNTHKLLLELYDKHLDTDQLQALLDFHTSDMGRSIKVAQDTIKKEMMRREKEQRGQKGKSGSKPVVMVRRKILSPDDHEPSS
jgi:hypothetical protein